MDARHSWLSVLPLLLLSSSCLYAHSHGCSAPEFVKGPENVEVNDGESVSFYCVLTEQRIDEWFINESFPFSTNHPDDSYVSWSDCTPGPKLCGGTLFIKEVDMSFNGSTIACHVAHSNCEGQNVSMSQPALIIVRELSRVESAEAPSSLPLSPSSSLLSPSPSPSPPSSPPPSRKPPINLDDKSSETDKTTVRVTERLVQRVPLMAAAAGVCFVVGCVFGTMCAVTVSRGTSRCRRRRKHRRRRRSDIQISSPVQSQAEPNYAELTPVRTTPASSSASRTLSENSSGTPTSRNTNSNGIAANNNNTNNNTRSAANNIRSATNSSNNTRSAANSNASTTSGPSLSGQEGRRENEYTELGMPDTPQFQRPSPASARAASSSGASSRDSGAAYCEGLSGPPLPPRGNPQEQCQTCIEVDLDELERAVLQQN